MYKLSQWAGDFPNALGATRELHASVHEPTRGTSLFQICVTAFAYISILSCFPVSYINPPHPRASFIPPPPSLFWTRAVQISRNCRCQLVLQRTDGRTRGQELSRCWWIKLSVQSWLTVSGYRLTRGAVGVTLMKRVLLTIRSGSCGSLHSQRHPVSPFPPLIPICSDWQSLIFFLFVCFFPPVFLLLGQRFLELYIGKYCIRLQYSCG